MIVFFKGFFYAEFAFRTFRDTNANVYPKNIVYTFWRTAILKIYYLRNVVINKTMEGSAVLSKA